MRRHRVPRQVPRRLYRSLAQAGAEILAVPAAFIKVTGEAHWHVLNHARAIDNGRWIELGDFDSSTEARAEARAQAPDGFIVQLCGNCPRS